MLDGNSVEIIESGDETFKRLLEMISSSEKSINMEFYIYRNDRLGRLFADALCEKAKTGVEVNVIIDSFGARFMGKYIPRKMRESGVRLHFYHPISLLRYTKFMKRTHRKMVIVDGLSVMTGGFNMSGEWLDDVSGDATKWRDVQVFISGPAVFQAQSIFMEHWFELTGEILTGDRYFPPLSITGRTSCRVIGSSPLHGSSTLQQIYLFALSSSRKRFWMENAYFVPDRNSVKAICDASMRGVDVRIIIPGLKSTDAKAPVYAARNYYYQLLSSKVKIYEYRKKKLHSKFAVSDGLWATIGSTNFDNRSFKFHEEMNVNIYDSEFVGRMEKIFLADIEDSTEVKIKKFRKRTFLPRLQEYLYKLIEEQL